MRAATYPLLYQINTRVLLTEIARRLGRPATLDAWEASAFRVTRR